MGSATVSLVLFFCLPCPISTLFLFFFESSVSFIRVITARCGSGVQVFTSSQSLCIVHQERTVWHTIFCVIVRNTRRAITPPVRDKREHHTLGPSASRRHIWQAGSASRANIQCPGYSSHFHDMAYAPWPPG